MCDDDAIEYSIVDWGGRVDKYRCEYCKNPEGSSLYGMQARSMLAIDYQNLIDRGWVRYGTYLFKSVTEVVCCPQYTIKCDAIKFRLSRSQKKVLKKMYKFLNEDKTSNTTNVELLSEKLCENSRTFERTDDMDHIISNLKDNFDRVVGVNSSGNTKTKNVVGADNCSNRDKTKKGVGADPNKPLQKKAKLLRIKKPELSSKKLLQNNQEKTLEDFFGTISENPKHELEVTLEQIDENHESFDLVLDLYGKYQKVVHNDTSECTKERYVDFLIESPLHLKKFGDDSNLGFGSFHQLYWLDKKLIAVGVIDILPKCISSVYFFYDPDYKNLNLGTYGALREIKLVRKLNKLVPSIEYYYIGSYVHTSKKVRYMGRLSPSYLLCPESYCWIEIEKCIPKLEQSKYCRLNDDLEAVDENACQHVENMKIFCGDSFIPLYELKNRFEIYQEFFDLIGKLVGRKLLRTLLIDIGVGR